MTEDQKEKAGTKKEKDFKEKSKKSEEMISQAAPGQQIDDEVEASSESEQELPGNNLLQKLKEEEGRAETLLNDLKRLKADFENYKKRMVKEQTNFLKYAKSDIIAELLPVVDNLERAIQATDNHKNEETIKQGIEMVKTQLLDILTKEGVETIEPIGEPFNPEEHEAFLQVETNEHPEDTVVEVIQKGYRLKGKILRPATVKVSK